MAKVEGVDQSPTEGAQLPPGKAKPQADNQKPPHQKSVSAKFALPAQAHGRPDKEDKTQAKRKAPEQEASKKASAQAKAKGEPKRKAPRK
jgi:hypothetical protein